VLCESCGTQSPPDSRFCNKCGAPRYTRVPIGEYKQVTVLFADVAPLTANGDTAGWPEPPTRILTVAQSYLNRHQDRALLGKQLRNVTMFDPARHRPSHAALCKRSNLSASPAAARAALC